MSKPRPVITAQECDVCGLEWGLHPEEPSTKDCVALLRAELARSNSQVHFAPPWTFTSTSTTPALLSVAS